MASPVIRQKYVRPKAGHHPPAFTQAGTCSRIHLTTHPSASPTVPTVLRPSRKLKLALCRLKLQWITGLLAGISLALTVASRWQVGRESPATTTTMGVGSVVQVWLVLCYRTQERKSALLTSRAMGTVGWEKPKSRRLLCVLECFLHLLIPLPRDYLLIGVRVNTIAYVLLLIRNYHVLRLLYWISPFSSLRANVFNSLCDFKIVHGVMYRHFVLKWGHVGAVLAVLALCGLLEAVKGLETVEKALKAMARLGEGGGCLDPVEVVIVLGSVAVGVVLTTVILTNLKQTAALTVSQSQLCTALSAKEAAYPHKVAAAFLLQAWWRISLMRRRHRFDVFTVFAWYRTLLAFAARPAVPQSKNAYSLVTHLAAIETQLRVKILKIRKGVRLSRRLDTVIIKEAQIMRKANILAGQKEPRLLCQGRLPTIREVVSDLSSPLTGQTPHR